jgi:hypothetical protein
LTSDKNEEESSHDIKIEENDVDKEFPWDTVNNLNPFSRFTKIKLKCLLTSFFQSHPSEVKNTLQNSESRPQTSKKLSKPRKPETREFSSKKKSLNDRTTDSSLSTSSRSSHVVPTQTAGSDPQIHGVLHLFASTNFMIAWSPPINDLRKACENIEL